MEKFSNSFQPDTYYHVYNHAIGHENLFRNTGNYHYFLKKYAEYLHPVCQTYAYRLMPNHFHLLIKIRSRNILFETLDFHKLVMLQFQHFLNGYAQAIKKQFNRKGGLFLNHLKRIVIPTDSYFTSLIHYIHFNPIHHGFCRKLSDWQHSSYNAFLLEKTTRLERDEILNWFGNREQYLRFHELTLDTHRFSEIEF
jgi:putative transposase